MNAISPIPPLVNEDGIEFFTFGGHSIRIVRKEVDGRIEPWFIASDVCTSLKLSNPTMSMKALDPDEWSKFNLGGRQGDVLIVSESGMNSLIMRCKRATVIGSTAHQFRRWVTKTVLPSIRETGSYGRPVAAPVDPLVLLQDPATLIALLGVYATKTQVLETANKAMSIDLACAEAVIELQEPIVEAYEEIVDADGLLCITDAAKAIGVAPSVLFAHMRDQDRSEPWIYCRPGRPEVAFQTRLNRKELDQKAVKDPATGRAFLRQQVFVYPKALFLLRAEMVQKERDRRRAAGELDL
ncbi:BRO family protein [Methylobacterium sp. WL7]|uniref:BRO family protein n=1 Tax=Methylobacterium sp. WL7 TaxID=2603900 RepID=UPI0011C985FF|nr:BRO family protein [Methylobacterium sp. WL7]TXN47352.1 hypothetical protein FV233_04805 [Methylobacterium sp. WL7]